MARFRDIFAIVLALISVLAGMLLIGSYLVFKSGSSVSPNPDNIELEASGSFSGVDWNYWRSVNPDIVGWVSIPGTSVDYPVVRASTDDPGFYLDHDIRGRWSPFGTPYLDAECDGLVPCGDAVGRVALVYGHNMDDGSVFSPLLGYLDREFLLDHPIILLQTPSCNVELEVLGCGTSNAHGGKRVAFQSDADYREWLSAQLADVRCVNDDARSRVTDGEDEGVLVLCTCGSSLETDTRVLVYASFPYADG